MKRYYVTIQMKLMKAVLSRASFCYAFALVLAWNTLQRTVMCDLSKKQNNRQYFHVLPLVDQYNLC